MAEMYSFVTRWEVDAPVPQVYDLINDPKAWPQWWKGVVAVKDVSAEYNEATDEVLEYTWKSRLPYSLTFRMRLAERVPYHSLSGKAFGELEGSGTWTFEEKAGKTLVQYNWDVYTNKSWMNFFSFILKPLFRYNHDVVMRWGAECLALKLGRPVKSL